MTTLSPVKERRTQRTVSKERKRTVRNNAKTRRKQQETG